MGQISSKLSELVSKVNDWKSSQNPIQINELSALLNTVSDFIRRKHQKDNAKVIRELLSKLKNGYNPHETDLALLAEFMIGEARYYVEANQSTFEVAIKRLSTNDFSFITSSKLQEINALIEELKISLREIQLYLPKKEQIENFERAVKDGLDKNESKLLAEIIEFKLKSEHC